MQSLFKRCLILFLSWVLIFISAISESKAFDYLEHLYFTDHACQEVLEQLLIELNSEDIQSNLPLKLKLTQRAIALALLCPIDDGRAYCSDGRKLALGALTPLSERPEDGGDYSLTLGDLAALPDHIAEFGRTPLIPRAQKDGLMTNALLWIAQEEGGVDGTLEDVAEDACEGAELVDWHRVQKDIKDGYLHLHQDGFPQLPQAYLSSTLRAPLKKGPSDPAGLYSFDNPHYLDLVFRNHHHFGEHAYRAWLGFHTVATDLADLPCHLIISDDDDLLEELADEWPRFRDIDWSGLPKDQRAIQGCELLQHMIQVRLEGWIQSLTPAKLQQWSTHLRMGLSELSKGLISPVLSLIYEGSGLHFLQDSLAGGHMRTIRTRGGLQEARYDHDQDNQYGLVARHITSKKATNFVGYGDSYLLGFGPVIEADPQGNDSLTDPCEGEHNSIKGARCALRVQRAIIANSTVGSLIDWAHGGLLFENESRASSARLRHLVSVTLPTIPPGVASGSSQNQPHLQRSDLPVPPPPFSYQSLSHRLGLDLAGGAPRFTLQLGLLDTLGSFAHWLTSYRMGLNTTLGSDLNTSWSLEGGYAFHFRWAARFTIDMGILGYLGWRDFNRDVDTYLGLSPIVGFTILPEGWLKMPLEASVNYQIPLTFYDQSVGFPGLDLIEGHYLGVSLGLAFMR